MTSKIQNNKIKNALYNLGFNHKEVLVYLYILINKESNILNIAEETEISRGTAYDVVEKLKTKGFLTEKISGKKRKIIAENPTNKFYSILDKKHKELNKSKIITDELIKNIKALDVLENYQPKIKTYKGEKGFKQVWDDIFSSKTKQWLGIAKIETFNKFGGDGCLEKLQQRKIDLGFRSKAINEDSELARKLQFNDNKYNRETKIAPSEFKFDTTEIIYENKIAMFSTKNENIIVIIESNDFSNTHRVYFEMLWKFLQ